MVINQDQLRIWIAALRSGQYQQTNGSLNNDQGYCCLGVACKVLIPADKLVLNNGGFIYGAYPDEQPEAPQWLKNINDDFMIHGKHFRSLANLNDSKTFTFAQIADELEKTYLPNDTPTTTNT